MIQSPTRPRRDRFVGLDSPAERAIHRAARAVTGIALADVNARAGLQTRHDRKYLIDTDDVAAVVALLADDLGVLQIDGLRSFDYESCYFDTPRLLAYHEHRLARQRRFKVRTRTYLDSGQTMFEVKLSDPDRGTIKHRCDHDFATRTRLTSSATRNLERVLERAGRKLPGILIPTATIVYRRTTFVAVERGIRITCDRDLTARGGGRSVHGLTDCVLVEVKSAGITCDADRALARLGHLPVSVSKYAACMSLLHRGLPVGAWAGVLDRHVTDRTPRAAA